MTDSYYANQIEQLLKDTNNLDGWAGLGEQADEVSEKQKQQQALAEYELAKTVAAPFMTPHGRECLQTMRERLCDPAKFPVDTMGLINAVGYGVFREGQASVVRWIDACIKVAEQGPPQPTDGDEQQQQ